MAVQDDVWNYDVNPTASSLTAKGALWDAYNRSGAITNSQLPDVQAKLVALQADVDTLTNLVNSQGATLTAMNALIQQITNEPGVDPNIWYDVMKQAVIDAS